MLANYKTVGVILPTYNRQKQTIRALFSILGQTYPATVICIVDDGSSPRFETNELLRTYAERLSVEIVLIHNDSNRGVSFCRNLGMSRIVDLVDYVGFIDSDDMWGIDKVRLQVSALEVDRHLDGVGCRWTVGVDGDRYRTRVSNSTVIKKSTGFFLRPYPPIPSIMLRADRVKGFAFDETFDIGEDQLFLIELISSRNIATLDYAGLLIGRAQTAIGGLTGNVILAHESLNRLYKKLYSEGRIGMITWLVLFVCEQLRFILRLLKNICTLKE